MLKDFQYLSKRRKNQLINYELNYYRGCKELYLTDSSTASNNSKIKTDNCLFTNVSNIFNRILPQCLNEISESNMESQSDVESNEENSIETQSNISEINNVSDCSEISNISDNGLRENLQKLIVERNITHNTANELLATLRKHGHIDLPSDVRVLFQTPRNAFLNIKSLGGGCYVHFSFSSSLIRFIQIYSEFIKGNNIKLNINIDGLPLCKSSGS